MMSQTKNKPLSRVMAGLMTVVMLVALLPSSIFAVEATGTVTTTVGEELFTIGEVKEFTVTTTANSDANKLVRGSFEISDPDAIATLEYLEPQDGQWYALTGDFGPETGFPMIDGTSKFRVSFNKVGEFDVTVSIKTVENSEVVCTTTEKVCVRGTGEVTGDIASKEFVVGEKTEFTFTTTANGDANKLVRGSFTFSDPDAIATLEYLETQDGQWYALTGDFGPETGFPLIDGTSTFRASFNKGGSYEVTVSMKLVDGGAVLCSTTETVTVKNKVTVSAQCGEGGSLLFNEDTVYAPVTVVEGETVKVNVKADDGYQIGSVKAGATPIDGAAGQKEFSADVQINEDTVVTVEFIKLWTVTVSASSDGEVVTTPAGEGGSVTVEAGTSVTVTATPNEHYHVSEVLVNGEKDTSVKGENNEDYTTTLTADKDYTVEVIFAPNVYSITFGTIANGTAAAAPANVVYNNNAVVTITPESGYMVDTVTVDGVKVDAIVLAEDGTSSFEIANVAKDMVVNVTFKTPTDASVADVTINSSADLRPDDEGLFVIKNGDKIEFSTGKNGIKVYAGTEWLGGDERTQSVAVGTTKTVTKIELFYQAEGDYYAQWHKVADLPEAKIVVDAGINVPVLTPAEANENGYYNADFEVEVDVEDPSDYSGIASVEYFVTTDVSAAAEYDEVAAEKKTQSGTLYTHDATINATVKDLKITVDAKENNTDNVVVWVKVTDRAGNVSVANATLKVNSTAPQVAVKIEGGKDSGAANGAYYNSKRKLTITITDRATTFAPDQVKLTVVDGGEAVDTLKWSSEGDDEYEASYEFEEDGEYNLELTYTNKAGLSNGTIATKGNDVTSFTLDKTAPVFDPDDPEKTMNIQLVADAVVEDGMKADAKNESIVDKNYPKDGSVHVFNVFHPIKVTVSLSATDGLSGVQSLQYQKLPAIPQDIESGSWETYPAGGIVVEPNEKFVIYFKATDNAGNSTIIRSNGVVVDNKQPVGETKAPELDIILPDVDGENGFYKSDVEVNLAVIDPKLVGAANGFYSGLNKITYKIYDPDTQTEQTGVLFDINSEEPVNKGQIQQADGLVSSWTGSIVINTKEPETENDPPKFNSNNVVVELTAVDNAGNSRVTTVEGIKIDVTKPAINVAYNNNDADTVEKPNDVINSHGFFKADRTATIVVTERNFNPENVKITITKDGKSVSVEPKDVVWTQGESTGNGDDTTWTATVSYTEDGDYTFGISCTDNAGLENTDVTYVANPEANPEDEKPSVAPKAFTIDKTLPVVTVSYDNNSALNGNYYKAERTATIEIVEHNMDLERIDIALTATDDGADSALPAVSEWEPSESGDKYTATIAYAADSLYSFDIEVSDKAGNVYDAYAGDTFYVDKTAPALDITGVANYSANNGTVIPVVTYSDTNFDADEVTITLRGANRGAVALDGGYTEIHNGQTFTFRNFAEEKEIDDIYTLYATLTDKAGNSSEETITFSVNRFGSTYAFSEETAKLNGTYVKVAPDVVVTETNVDELSGIKVTLFKNNETIVLQEGLDYSVDVTGGNGQWYHYTYTVFAKNFAKDGVYSLTFESTDEAGNAAKNDQDTKNAQISFGVDATLPIVNISNLESDTTYAVDSLTVEMSVKDNLKLTEVIVELDGKKLKSWSGTALETLVKNGGNFAFDIAGDSTSAHTLVVYAVDAAGNGAKIASAEIPANAETVEGFFVTTNLWVRYYTNKPLFFGSIGGGVGAAGLIVFLAKKKKKEEEK